MSIIIEQTFEDKLASLPKDKRVSVKQFMKKYNIEFDDALRLRECNDEMRQYRIDNPKSYTALDEYQELLEESREIRNKNRDQQSNIHKGRMNVQQLMKRYAITEEAATELHENISRRDELMNEVNQLLQRAKYLRSKTESTDESTAESTDE